jgi:hypothetical protein
MTQIDKVSFAGNPGRVVEEVYDCIWVMFAKSKEPTAIASPVVQALDWKMGGLLSRFIIEPPKSKTTFVPTMSRIPSALLALEPLGKMDWTGFAASCSGMAFRQVLVLSEGMDSLGDFEREIRRLSLGSLHRVVLGTDGPVGRS